MQKSASKGKGKNGKKQGQKLGETEDIAMIRLLKCYDRNCVSTESQMCPIIKAAMRKSIEAEKLLTRFILTSIPIKQEGDVPVLMEPFLAAIQQERYSAIKDLHIWDYPMSYENIAALSLMMEKPVYCLRQLEMIYCLLDVQSISRFTRSFDKYIALTILNLDYNEFGDAGCEYICKGLNKNTSLLSLSMCYCSITKKSGMFLGHVLSTTAVREMYLDGNDLECEGVIELVNLCVDNAESEAYERAQAKKLAIEQAQLLAEKEREGRQKSVMSESGNETDRSKSSSTKTGSVKKKKGKKKKKKEPPPPPKVGPWVHKLHLADNGIDAMGENREISLVICMRHLKKLLLCSTDIQEIDLEHNLIGDLGGREIMEGLTVRKEDKFSDVKVRTTHRMNSSTFTAICKLGSGLKKKGKKKKKKK